jgi:hypothetical protein
MRYFPFILLCFLCVAKSYGQTGPRSYHTLVVEITKEKKPKKISAKVEITPPAFPNGDSAWVHSFEDSLNRTLSMDKKKVKPGKYVVSVRFLLEKDGNVNDIHCLNDPGFGLCEQVRAAVIRQIRPRWGPGEVRQYHTTSTTPKDE